MNERRVEELWPWLSRTVTRARVRQGLLFGSTRRARQFRQSLFIVFTFFLLFCVLIYELRPSPTKSLIDDSKKPPAIRNYIILIDAGSSGSRLHIYEYAKHYFHVTNLKGVGDTETSRGTLSLASPSPSPSPSPERRSY